MKLVQCLSLLALSSAFAACSMLDAWKDPAPEQVHKTAPIATEPVLYARDGSIVSPEGSSAASLPRRDVQGADGSRSKILELYQRVVEERDRLSLELIARDAELAQLRKAIDGETARASLLEERVKAAEQKTGELESQNLDLAARLTTAQLRRLEAEKKWLEAAIAQSPKPLAALQKTEVQAPAAGEPRPADQP